MIKGAFEKAYLQLGVTIRDNGSCSCRVNVQIVSTFANTIPTHLLFVLGMSTRI